jgi:cytochrome c556
MTTMGRKLLLAFTAGTAVLAISMSTAASAQDKRELVEMPAMMQEHMLANMRDHLRAIEEILGHLANGDVDSAGKVAESRLGMSSLETHGASHMARFMPEGMAEAGAEMHRAASRFVIVAQDAELAPGRESEYEVYRALEAVTAACNACHQAYRIR